MQGTWTKTGRAFLVAMLFIAIAGSAVADENWPAWRGPTGDGVSTATELPIVWSERRTLQWRTPLPGAGASTPAIWGDAVFVTSQNDTELQLSRINRRNGNVEWTEKVGEGLTVREAPPRSTQKFHNIHNLATPSPLTDGEVVIVHFGNGELAGYDFDGKQQWRRNLQDDHGGYTIWWGHSNSPVLYGNVVVSVCMQDSLDGVAPELTKSYLVAHDKRNGNQRWVVERMTGAKGEEADSYTTPLLVRVHGVDQLILMGGNQLDAYDPLTGRQYWLLKGLTGGRTVTGPTIADGWVFTTIGMRGDTLAVDLKKSLPVDFVKSEKPVELTRRDIVWRDSVGTPDSCSPVAVNNLLFQVADNGILRCIDPLTGNLHFKERLAGDYKASPVAADGRVYFVNTQGLCTVVSASSRFHKLSENPLPDEMIASPAIVGHEIFLRGKAQLWCIGQ